VQVTLASTRLPDAVPPTAVPGTER